ncbi:MAG: putative membrane protein YesL [Cognaticolwellia sp.]|jgi:uncharacterized membrane protein YesL
MMTKIIKPSVKQDLKPSLKHSFKQKFKSRNSENNALQLTSQMYFCLLIFQLLSLATLVIQLHLLYLLFATFSLALQFIVYLNIARKDALASRLSQSIKSYVIPITQTK